MRRTPALLRAGGSAVLMALASATSAGAAPTVTRTEFSFIEPFAGGAIAEGVNAAGTAWGVGSLLTGLAVVQSCAKGFCIPVVQGTSADHALLWKGSTFATDITPLGASSADLIGLGDDGTAIGTAVLNKVTRSFVWKAGKTTLLPVGTTAGAVASNGLVAVGFAATSSGETLGLWNNGVTTTVATGVPAGIVKVNAAGTIVEQVNGALVEYSGGKSATLPLPAGTAESSFVSFDDQGRVLAQVGSDAGLSGPSEGVLWKGSVATGTWSGTRTTYLPLPGQTDAEVAAINASGVVVGTSQLTAAEWPATGGVPKPLATGVSTATGISDNGTVIGTAGLDLNDQRIWTPSGTAITAFTGNRTTGTLTGISSSGLVVGWGDQIDILTESPHGYEWTVTGS